MSIGKIEFFLLLKIQTFLDSLGAKCNNIQYLKMSVASKKKKEKKSNRRKRGQYKYIRMICSKGEIKPTTIKFLDI